MTNRAKREGVFGKTTHFDFLVLREGERREREHLSFSLRSSEFLQLEFIELRVKVHLLDEGYVYIPKERDFTEDQKEEVSGNQEFWAGEASYVTPLPLVVAGEGTPHRIRTS